jgi:MscS family membrane protein
MQRIRARFILVTALCLIFSGLPSASNAQDLPPEESKTLAEEDQNVYSIEQDIAKYPLQPPDTSSPRATLQGFLDNMNRAYSVLMAAHRNNLSTPGLFASKDVQQMAKDAKILFERSVSCLDLSEIPQTLRENTGYEGALKLKEIFDRIELPPFEQIPDLEQIEEMEEHEESPEAFRWRVPNTLITIARVGEGPRQGEFLFTSQTVARLPRSYLRVKELPYKSDSFVSHDFLDFYTSTPGQMLPPKWNQWLPAWSAFRFFGLAVWQWCALILSFSLALLFLKTLYRRFRSQAASLSTAGQLWQWVVFALVTSWTLVALRYVLIGQINITGVVVAVLRPLGAVIGWSLTAAAVFLGGRATAETIIASPTIKPDSFQASYLRAIFWVFGFVSAAVILIYGLSQVGVSLAPLLTSVGIGGIAVALAARSSIENIISSFTIFADKPYEVGQRIKVLGHDGTVEAIGLRSTRIRLLSGHLTTIPNQQMASAEIENIGRRPYIRRIFDVTITYDTPPEKIARAEEILREILAVPDAPGLETSDSTGELADTAGTEELADTATTEDDTAPHPNEAINQPDFPPRVYFNDFKADSLNILVIYWYHPPRYWDYLEHARWVNLQIMERFNTEGIDFAFPTRTLHLAGDDKRPLTVGQRWVSKDETFSPSAILAQAAALGAQAVQTSQTPVSDAVRPKPPSQPKPAEELSDAPLEDEFLHSDDAGEAGEAQDDGDGER